MNPIDKLKQEASEKKKATVIDMYFDLFVKMAEGIHDKVFLKGNILLNKLLPNSARTTQDLDFSVINPAIFNEYIKPRFIAFAEQVIDNGLADHYTVKEMRDGNTGTISLYNGKELVYNIDVGNTKGLYCGIIEYTFNGTMVLGSSIDKILCDKLKAILSSRRLHRKKDLYNIYVIVKSDLKFELNKVYELMIESSPDGYVKELLRNYPFTEKGTADLNGAWGSL